MMVKMRYDNVSFFSLVLFYLDINIGARNMEPDLAPLAADRGAVQPHVLSTPSTRNKPNRRQLLKSAIIIKKNTVLPSIMNVKPGYASLTAEILLLPSVNKLAFAMFKSLPVKQRFLFLTSTSIK